jgi:hypothetical protein
MPAPHTATIYEYVKRFQATGFALHSMRTCGRNEHTKQGTPDKIWARLKTTTGNLYLNMCSK